MQTGFYNAADSDNLLGPCIRQLHGDAIFRAVDFHKTRPHQERSVCSYFEAAVAKAKVKDTPSIS